MNPALLLPLLAGAADPACAADAAAQLICADPELRAAERELDARYAAALTNLPPAARTQAEAQEAAWRGERASCTQPADAHGCLAAAIARRGVALAIVTGTEPVFATVTYHCADAPLEATYFRGEPLAVRVQYRGSERLAFLAPAGSGARYTAAGLELWEHQGVARFTLEGRTLECPKR